jgi:hypothetical protein
MSGRVRLSVSTLRALRKLWNSLNFSRISLGSFGFFERPLEDGSVVLVGSVGC